jgi:hypothetical protein
MIRVDIKIDNKLQRELQSIKRQLAAYPDQALAEFKRLTPVRSGNARRKTTLRSDTIDANYAYAQRLDSGWSKQAPDGMTKPFGQWVARRVKQIFGK